MKKKLEPDIQVVSKEGSISLNWTKANLKNVSQSLISIN